MYITQSRLSHRIHGDSNEFKSVRLIQVSIHYVRSMQMARYGHEYAISLCASEYIFHFAEQSGKRSRRQFGILLQNGCCDEFMSRVLLFG